MTMPNFLLIGTAKAGTTAIYFYIAQHPQIFMSELKEPMFFVSMNEKPDFKGPGCDKLNRNIIYNFEDYQALFAGTNGQRAIGEASTWYLYYPQACQRIKQALPNAKLMACLRHPVERAYSAFLHLIRDGLETYSDFGQAIRAEPQRVRDHWEYMYHYTRMSLYYEQCKRYLDTFGRDQVRFYLYEDFEADPLPVLRDMFGFLEVDDTFVPDTDARPNAGLRKPKSRLLHSFLMQPSLLKSAMKPFIPQKLRRRLTTKVKMKNLAKPPFMPEVRAELLALFRDDVLRTQDLIGKDLSHWLR